MKWKIRPELFIFFHTWNSPGGECNFNYQLYIAMERSNWGWCQCFVTVFLPLSEWGLLSTAALKIQLQISYLPMVFYQVGTQLWKKAVPLQRWGKEWHRFPPRTFRLGLLPLGFWAGWAVLFNFAAGRRGLQGAEQTGLHPAEGSQDWRWHSARPGAKPDDKTASYDLYIV